MIDSLIRIKRLYKRLYGAWPMIEYQFEEDKIVFSCLSLWCNDIQMPILCRIILKVYQKDINVGKIIIKGFLDSLRELPPDKNIDNYIKFFEQAIIALDLTTLPIEEKPRDVETRPIIVDFIDNVKVTTINFGNDDEWDAIIEELIEEEEWEDDDDEE